MANNLRAKESVQQGMMDNYIQDDAQDFFDLRMEMGKSISAPPPGLESMVSPSPDFTRGGERDSFIATEKYYHYYHSIKPHDPRLPLPKWNPSFYNHGGFQEFAQPQNEGQDMGGLRKGSLPEKFGDMNNFSNQFEQSMNLNMNDNFQGKPFNKPQSPHMHYDDNMNKKPLNIKPMSMQQDNQGYNMGNSPVRKASYPVTGGQQNFKQNQMQHGQQPYGNQHGPHGHHNPNARSHQQNPNQGQFYQGMEQQQQMNGGYFNQQFMNPQMQGPNFYGMNNFQPQMYPYGMDPNMMQNPNQFQNMQNPQFSQGNRMNQMPDMNQMGGMNQFYNQSYQQNYYPMGYPQNMQGNFQQQQNFNNQQPMKGQKPTGKAAAPKLDIKYVMSHLVENCRDQNGSRLIQQQFEKSNEQEKEQIFQQILPHAYSLMTDVFGNYVLQKILELGTVEQKIKIFDAMKGNIFQLSQHTYGCRVVQKILEELKINGPVQDQILNELRRDIVTLIEDQNGNHVIQKCFETMPSEKVQFIMEEVTENIDELAFHPYGCRVIQRILEHSSPEITEPMLGNLMSSALKCCESQYGNYITQYILEKGPQAQKIQLLDVLKDNFVRLSMNKFASNVTEKSVKHGTPEFRRDVVTTLCNSYYDNKPALVVMMTHSFGNYVVQRLFECSDENLRQMLYDKMQGGILEEIKKNNYGKHVMTFIEKFMEGKRK